VGGRRDCGHGYCGAGRHCRLSPLGAGQSVSGTRFRRAGLRKRSPCVEIPELKSRTRRIVM
jgi:hypothetical protein